MMIFQTRHTHKTTNVSVQTLLRSIDVTTILTSP